MKSSVSDLQSRGYVDESKIIIDEKTDTIFLGNKLFSEIPTDRTEAAMIIKMRNIEKLIPKLIEALKIEKKLYCKLAISDALVSFKEKSVEFLIPYLGSIGKNQHHKLPSKPFRKDSYPLPRDIVARILVKNGIIAVPKIIEQIETLSRTQILESIDVLGHISFYTKDETSLPVLLELYNNNKEDKVMIWKLLRSFSAFNNEEVTLILNKVKNVSTNKVFLWEVERSLGLIEKRK